MNKHKIKIKDDKYTGHNCITFTGESSISKIGPYNISHFSG